MEVIPAVDILDGRVVRLRQGHFDEVTDYATDPVDQLEAFAAAGARLVHVVDLEGARDGTTNAELVRRLAGAGVAFQLGGGIRTLARAETAIAAGARRVVVGTAAVWEAAVVAEMVRDLGADRIVAALDVAEGMATGAGWLDAGRPLHATVQGLQEAGVVRALVTGIARDGTMAGPDLDVVYRVAELAPSMSLIASGGVGSLDDLRTLATTPVEAAIVGRALYERRFTLGEALEAAAGA